MRKNKKRKKNKGNTNKKGANTEKKGTNSVKEDENASFDSKNVGTGNADNPNRNVPDGGDDDKDNNESYSLTDKIMDFLKGSSKIIAVINGILLLFIPENYENIFDVPSFYFLDMDLLNISKIIFIALIIVLTLIYVVPFDFNEISRKEFRIAVNILFVVISALNIVCIFALIFPVLYKYDFPIILPIFILLIVGISGFFLMKTSFKKRGKLYTVLCCLSLILYCFSIIFVYGFWGLSYKEFELIDYDMISSAQINDDNSWKLLKDGVVVSHHKDKLVVMDGLIKDNDLIILKPGYKIIDFDNVNLKKKGFKNISTIDRREYYPWFYSVQRLNDNIVGGNLVLNMNEYDVYSDEFIFASNKKLNKCKLKIVGNGNIIFYDVNVSGKDSDRRLKDDEYRLIKTDKGFSLSLTKAGINVLNENQDGIKIGYKAKLDSDIKDLDRNIIATSFDYGFNTEKPRTNKYGYPKDGKINLLVGWDDLSDKDKNINSIFVLQEKNGDAWKDVGYYATDSVKGANYTFDGLDDNKLYRILPIISESFDSDCVRFQEGVVEIVNIKNDEDFIGNKVYIQEFNIKNDYNKKTDNEEPVNKVTEDNVNTGVGGLYFDKLFNKCFHYFGINGLDG